MAASVQFFYHFRVMLLNAENNNIMIGAYEANREIKTRFGTLRYTLRYIIMIVTIVIIICTIVIVILIIAIIIAIINCIIICQDETCRPSPPLPISKPVYLH